MKLPNPPSPGRKPDPPPPPPTRCGHLTRAQLEAMMVETIGLSCRWASVATALRHHIVGDSETGYYLRDEDGTLDRAVRAFAAVNTEAA